jgi:beta-glucosidase
MSITRWRRAAAGGLLVGATLGAAGPARSAQPAVGRVGAPAGTERPAGRSAALPYRNPALTIPDRVADLLGRMTTTEKVGQLVITERRQIDEHPEQITDTGLGGLESAGGSTPTPDTPAAWADMVDHYQALAARTRLGIPLLYGIDAVHGNGYLPGATVFPHAIGLGATRDPALVEQVGAVTAAETRAAGPNWVFGPCLCVARDDRWGRTYESFGEDPSLVTLLATEIDGLQGGGAGSDSAGLAGPGAVLATAKHFAGDGDTEYGTSTRFDYRIDQGTTVTGWPAFERIDLHPFEAAVHRGAGAVMASYSSVDWISDGVGNPVKLHADRKLLTGILKDRYGFDGFLVSDARAVEQLPGDLRTQVRTAVNAGVDAFIEFGGWRAVRSALLDEVGAGGISGARLDDAVRRILGRKFGLGLFDRRLVDRSGLVAIGSAEHRSVARRAVAGSQVLLRNEDHLLPLPATASIYVAGSNADDIGNQSGGWTVTWQGRSGPTYSGGQSIVDGIRAVAPAARLRVSPHATAPMGGFAVGVVVVGETPYAEGHGDVGSGGHLNLSTSDRRAVDRVCAAMRCVVLVVAGRPQLVTDRLGEIDALVASWLPGSEGAGVADVLFGRVPFTGRLPVSWPRDAAQEPINVGDADYQPLFPYGYGLTTR